MPGILFATHGGASADGAGRVAQLLARRRGVSLSTVCVLEPLRIVDGGYASFYLPAPEEDEAVRSSLRASVTAQLQRCEASSVVQVRSGPPASEIANAARESGAEMIVLGLGRHRLLERALGNETALQLVQLASTPVLAVPATMTTLPRRVLVAVDFSPTSIASAKACARWLVKGDVLHLVHVVGVWHGGFPIEQRITTESMLAAIAHQLDAPVGASIEQSVIEGDPAEQLLQLAATSKADVIVLGSHGYGFWKRLTIGSVASKVIRLSTAAVFVTPIGSLGAIAPVSAATASGMAGA